MPPDFRPNPRWVDRYLAVLGLRAERPGLDALRRLTRAHKHTLPFENVTSILRLRDHGHPVPPVDHEVLLENWEAGRGGGVCYELAEMCFHLLTALGYEPLRVNGASREPGTHQASLVRIEGRRYLVDVGSGRPILDPIPLDRVIELEHMGARVRYRPGDSDGAWLFDTWGEDGWTRLFTFDIVEGGADEAARLNAYQRHHTPGYSFVIGPAPCVVRLGADAFYELRGGTFSISTPDSRTSAPATDPDEAEGAVQEAMGLRGLPVREAMDFLERIAAREPAAS